MVFRDGTAESHVPPTRMALSKSLVPSSQAQDVRFSAQDSHSHSSHGVEAEVENDVDDEGDYNLHLSRAIKECEEELKDLNTAEFIAETSFDIDAWIENDDLEEEADDFVPGLTLRSKSHGDVPYRHGVGSGLKAISYDSGSTGNYVSLDDDAEEGATTELTFSEPPLGLTLSVGANGQPEVTKTVTNGAAMRMVLL